MPATLTSDDCVENSMLAREHHSSQTRAVSAATDPSINGEFADDNECQEIENFFSFPSPVTLEIVCVGSAIGAVLCVVLLLWCWIRRRHQKKMFSDMSFDDSLESKIVKSAPSSRIASPKLSKCKSCPDALSVKTSTQVVLDPSITYGYAPNLRPSEFTQAGDSHDKTGSYFNGKTDRAAQITSDLCHDKSLFNDDEQYYPEAFCACLWFSVVYNEGEELLYVNLIKAENLPGRSNSCHLRDPFVKIFLMPDEKISRMSEVKKSTLSPVFNETHTFKLTTDDVRKHMLRLSVYDVDRRRVRHCLGHVVISLRNVDLTKGDIMWSKLESTIQNATSIGELQFSLIYIPSSEKIKVKIYNARNLKYMEDYLPVGVFVRAQLYYGHKCHSVKQTIVHQGEAEVTFNESLTFTARGQLLDSCNLKISVMFTSYKLNAGNEIEYGQVVVGTFMFAHGAELAHWQEMLDGPELASTHWHNLTSATSSP